MIEKDMLTETNEQVSPNEELDTDDGRFELAPSICEQLRVPIGTKVDMAGFKRALEHVTDTKYSNTGKK